MYCPTKLHQTQAPCEVLSDIYNRRMNNRDTPTTPAKNPGGRPALAAGQQSERVTVRLTPQQRETFERGGGATWLRDQLDGLKKILDAS